MPSTKDENRSEAAASDEQVSDEGTAGQEAQAEDQAKSKKDEQPEPQSDSQDSEETKAQAKDSADEDSDEEGHNSVGSDTGSPGRDPDKPMSDTQRTYLQPLADSQDENVREDMNEAEAAGAIDRLQENAVHVY
jgi:hypothetical protein